MRSCPMVVVPELRCVSISSASAETVTSAEVDATDTVLKEHVVSPRRHAVAA